MIERVAQERLSFGSRPIVLVGAPRRCVGLLPVHNPERGPVKLTRVRLRTAAEELLGRCETGALEIKLSATLCAGETRLLRVKLRLPPGTPEGRYDAYLDGAGKVSHKVAIEVLERRKLRLLPPAVSRSARPGETFTLCVTASNRGNVSVDIPARAIVELHAGDRGLAHHFHSAARARGEQGYASFLDAFVRRMGRDEPPLGRARVVGGAGPLAPLEGRLLEIEVVLPARLRRRRSYRAVVRLADAPLSLLLHMTAPKPAPSVAR